MNQKKQVSKAQKLARGVGERLGERPRTAATDESESAAPVNAWAKADRISDVITDAVNEELDRMLATADPHPSQVLAGLFLACMALFQTMPRKKPQSLQRAVDAIEACLLDMRDNGAVR